MVRDRVSRARFRLRAGRRATRTVLLFLLVNPGAAVAIVGAFVVSYAVLQNSLAGVQGARFCGLFPTKTRITGASLACQMSAVVSGFAPLIATALYAGYGRIGPALLLSGYGVLGPVAAVLTRGTWCPVEREVAVLERALAAEPAEPRTAGPGRTGTRARATD